MPYFYYFAYGSNLLKARLTIQNKGAIYVCNGRLDGFRLRFVTFGERWRGGLATITEDPDSFIYGCVWKIPTDFSTELDIQESRYHRLMVPIHCDEGQIIECRTYQVSDVDAPEFKPSPHYKTVIYAGAVEHNLPQEYLEKLFAIEDNGYRGAVEIDVDVIRTLNDKGRENMDESQELAKLYTDSL